MSSNNTNAACSGEVSPRYTDISAWSTLEAATAMYEGQLAAVAAVGSVLPIISSAAEAAAIRLRSGGRLVYAGSGTSGRLAAQDAAELYPTFGWPRERAISILAGGADAMYHAVEEAEDNTTSAQAAMCDAGVCAGDVVIVVSASGRTPFAVAAAMESKSRGASTIVISGTSDSELSRSCDICICVPTGSEAISGSTRMKAGTAQKVVLTMLSSLIMVRMGRVYQGLMIDMVATNEKLRKRNCSMVSQVLNIASDQAANLLSKAGDNVKVAILMGDGLDRQAAISALQVHDGVLELARNSLLR